MSIRRTWFLNRITNGCSNCFSRAVSVVRQKTAAHILTVLSCPLTALPLCLWFLAVTHMYAFVLIFSPGYPPTPTHIPISLVFPQNAQQGYTCSILLYHTQTQNQLCKSERVGKSSSAYCKCILTKQSTDYILPYKCHLGNKHVGRSTFSHSQTA